MNRLGEITEISDDRETDSRNQQKDLHSHATTFRSPSIFLPGFTDGEMDGETENRDFSELALTENGRRLTTKSGMQSENIRISSDMSGMSTGKTDKLSWLTSDLTELSSAFSQDVDTHKWGEKHEDAQLLVSRDSTPPSNALHPTKQQQMVLIRDQLEVKKGFESGDADDDIEEIDVGQDVKVKANVTKQRISSPWRIFQDAFAYSPGPTEEVNTHVYNKEWEKISSLNIPIIGIDGPYGTASMGAFTYEIAILIGAGIGVTPFARVLKSVWYKHVTGVPIKCRKVYFWWVCKDTFAFEWFTDMMKGLLELQRAKEHFLEYSLFITAAPELQEKSSLSLGSCYSSNRRRASSIHAIATFKDNAHRGRPDWDRLFRSVAHSHFNSKIGVFFCGPKSLSKILKQKCLVYSGSPEPECNFFFHKETF